MNDPASMRQFSYLLEQKWFYSVAVQPGDILIFSQRIPHWGPENIASVPRLAAFCQVSRPPPPKAPDAPAPVPKRKVRRAALAAVRRRSARPAAPKEKTPDTQSEEAFQVTYAATALALERPALCLCADIFYSVLLCLCVVSCSYGAGWAWPTATTPLRLSSPCSTMQATSPSVATTRTTTRSGRNWP